MTRNKARMLDQLSCQAVQRLMDIKCIRGLDPRLSTTASATKESWYSLMSLQKFDAQTMFG